MSLKNLFKGVKSGTILSNANMNRATEDIESDRYVDAYIENRARMEPAIDYATASNFAKFGLAEEYYNVAIRRTYQTYPYDGSLYEKEKWLNESNGLDLHVFRNEYPRTTGYIRFSPSGWGSKTSGSGSYGNPATKEYIYIKGGPHLDNVWHTASNRTSNLEIDGNRGNTVEFWLKKAGYNGLSNKEVIFDVWTTGTLAGDHKYGRLTVELDGRTDNTLSPFIITYQSGSSGFKDLTLGITAAAGGGASPVNTSGSDDSWHHYAIALQNTGSQINARLYIDGDLHQSILTGSTIGSLNTAMIATIGSLVSAKDANAIGKGAPYTTNPGLGWGKLSGSLDEFRFWKTKRSSRDIGRHWFTQVGGGGNTNDGNTDLGIYYKFNEGITQDSSIDKIVLDYSGRVSNGLWTGYTSAARSTRSAIVEASASLAEFKDPIVHSEHPDIVSLQEEKKSQGQAHDLVNAACLYHSFPLWILEEDTGDLKKIVQIMGSYFDSLFLKIQSLSELKHQSHEDYEHKPLPFMDRILGSLGLNAPEIFVDAEVLETIGNRSEDKKFEQKLHDVKNLIYRNIYNNLTEIYKSKGTERAFRNMLRCYGIDEELININVYADGVTYPIKENYRIGSVKKPTINFNRKKHFGATVFQASSSFDKSTAAATNILSHRGVGAHRQDPWTLSGYITSSAFPTSGMAFTTEAEVVFPKHFGKESTFHIDTPLSSSLFGCHTVPQTKAVATADDFTWRASAKDFANFEVYAKKYKKNSKNAKFILKSTSGIVPGIETDYFYDVYDNKKWNFAVRVAPKAHQFGDMVSGSMARGYNIEFFGVQTDAGDIQDRFFISSSLTQAQGQRFHEYSKRFYIGAHRQNFTGSQQTATDVRFSSLRHWISYLNNDTIEAHSIDPKSYGVSGPHKDSFTFVAGDNSRVPKIDTLALSWDFAQVTGSDQHGMLAVEDFSSGSLYLKNNYGWAGEIVGNYHPGLGRFFEANTTASIDIDYFYSARKKLPENVVSSDMVRPLTRDDQTYTRESTPVTHFFSMEKSMYNTISQEMLDFFATISDYGDIIGDPVNRYRPQYKMVEKLRQIFFRRIENDLDLEKYVEFYKWVDASLSVVLDQFKPATARFSEDIRTMIESHILERSKYWTKFPTLEMKNTDPVGHILGVNELLYDWEHGHAPLPSATGPVAATATFVGTAALNGADGTNLILTNADGSTVTFHTDPAKNYGDTSSDGGDHTWVINTRDISGGSEIRKATQAFHIACLAAIAAGELDMTAVPATNTGTQTSFILTQTTAGTAGNTAITLITGMTANGETSFTGGHRPNRAENANCLWWRDRASRTKEAPLSSSISTDDVGTPLRRFNSDRENIRKVANKVVSGSTYVINKLSRPYRFSVAVMPEIHGGDNFHYNKKKDFFLGTTHPESRQYIRISGSDIDTGRDCVDVHKPRYGGRHRVTEFYDNGTWHSGPSAGGAIVFEKRRFKGQADVSYTKNDYDLDTVAPFSLFSSSIDDPKDYKGEVYKNFKQGVEITNLHSDAYGDDREIPMQGPFTEKYVGGHFHRHVDLNHTASHSSDADGAAGVTLRGLDSRPTRIEGFFLTMSQGNLYVINPDMEGANFHGQSPSLFKISSTGSYGGRAHVLREPLAKRPVNIRNIRQTPKSGSILAGNFQHDYQIVQGTSPEVNKVFLVRETAWRGGNKTDLSVSGAGDNVATVRDSTKVVSRPIRKTYFVNRFSAPGGPETAGDAQGGPFLDFATNQYSVYNCLNYRNLAVRYPLDAQSMNTTRVHGETYGPAVITCSVTGLTDSLHIPSISFEFENGKKYAANTKTGVPASSSSPTIIGINSVSTVNALAQSLYTSLRKAAEEDFLPISCSVKEKFVHITPLQDPRSFTISGSGTTGSAPIFGHAFFERYAAPHKQNRNTKYVAVDTYNEGGVRPKHDNYFIQHQIPRSDLQYAWIKAATTETTASYNRFESAFTHPSGQDDATSLSLTNVTESSPEFVSASDGGYLADSSVASPYYGRREWIVGPGYAFIPVDFVGMNQVIVEPVYLDSNKLGSDFFKMHTNLNQIEGGNLGSGSASDLGEDVGRRVRLLAPYPGFKRPRFDDGRIGQNDHNYQVDVLLLNSLIHNRQGPYGWPSWKQLRVGQHPIARKLREANIYAPVVRADDFGSVNHTLAYSTQGNYSWPDEIDHKSSRTDRKSSVQRYRLTESAVSSKFGPITQLSILETQNLKTFEDSGTPREEFFASNPSVTSEARIEDLLAGDAQAVSRNVARSDIKELRFTYGNALATFSNKQMRQLFGIDEGKMRQRLNIPVTRNSVLNTYFETVYPKDENSYLKKARQRQQFKVNWWKQKRADRNVSQRSGSMSRGEGITGSVWPLDAQVNFGTSNEISLGTDDPNTFGEGALMANHSIFRSGSLGGGYPAFMIPSASATYARKFPETTYQIIFNCASHIANKAALWNGVIQSPDSGYDLSYHMTFYPPDTTSTSLYMQFVANTAAKTNLQNDPAAYLTLPVASDRWIVPVSGTVTSGEHLAKAIVSNFAEAGQTWKNYVTVHRDGSNVLIKFKGNWESSYWTAPGGTGFTGWGSNSQFSFYGPKMFDILKPTSKAVVHLAGGAKWEVGDQTGRNPFPYEDYDDWQQEMRRKAKDFSIIPEYRISEHMPYYVDSARVEDPFFTCHPDGIFELTGAADDFADSSKPDFFKVYGHSDFLKHFDEVTVDQETVNKHPGMLTLRCKAMKKFLPYEGFYPAQRTMQLATLLSESFGTKEIMPETQDNTIITGIRPMLSAFYAPGVCYNSIKSGLAVDYPIFRLGRDRPYNKFVTAFADAATNYVNIGQSSEWASLISGSAARMTGSAGEFSLSMWVNFYDDPIGGNTSSGSLLVFNDNDSVTKGIQFTKFGGRLMLGMFNDASNYKRWWTQGPHTLSEDDIWYHVCVTKKLDGSAPAFYINGVVTASQGGADAAGIDGTNGTLAETTVDMNSTSHDAGSSSGSVGNCTIGNHRYGHTQTNHSLNSMRCAIGDVSIWNTALSAESVKGLSGGGVKGRGPFTPHLCVEDSDAGNLIGWYRMGNDAGYVWSGSGSAHMTNNSPLKNWAMPLYRIGHLSAFGVTGSTGTRSQTTIPGSAFGTVTKGHFRGFTDTWSGKNKGAGQYGIVRCGDTGIASTTEGQLTGSLQIPSWITGSIYNETGDHSIPRIGSASWGKAGRDRPPGDDANFGTDNYWATQGPWGIGRVDRVPFEALISPIDYLLPNRFDTAGGPGGQRHRESFVFFDNEVHPSASFSSAGFLRQKINPGAMADGRFGHTRRDVHWGTPTTSSALSCSIDLTVARSLPFTTYEKAANNFYAECVKFFLDGGQTTTIQTADILQETIDYSKTYKMRIRLTRKSQLDFPMYNRPSSFGPPVDAGVNDIRSVYGPEEDGYGFAPYTPPHYTQWADVEYVFNPSSLSATASSGERLEFKSIEDVLSLITADNRFDERGPSIRFNRLAAETGSGGKNKTRPTHYAEAPYTSAARSGSLNRIHAMQISASFNGMAFGEGSQIGIYEDRADEPPLWGVMPRRQKIGSIWSIQSKWETPTLDFSKVRPVSPKPDYIGTAKGMWHQTGSYASPTTFLEIRPSRATGEGNLASLLGMHFQKGGRRVGEAVASRNVVSRPMGQLPERRKIKEAVIAIPFTENGDNRSRSFFNLPRGEIYQAAVNLGHTSYKTNFLNEMKASYVNTIMQQGTSDNEELNNMIRAFRDSEGFLSGNRGSWDAMVDRLLASVNEHGLPVRDSIQRMVKSMMDYVIPPRMNFLKYNDTNGNYVRPFLMYVFDFEHTLSKKDIAYIWQNTAPDLTLNTFYNNDRDTMIAQSSVTHDLSMLGNDVYGGAFGENVKWLVFKVKQRAETNYFKKMKRDKLPQNHPLRTKNVENDIFEYGYNWPYDYFSMIELVRLDTEVVYNTDIGAQQTAELLASANSQYTGLPGGEISGPYAAENYGFPTGPTGVSDGEDE